MGSICDVTEEVIDYLNAHGQKVGLVKVRLYRPWRADKLLAAIPATCKSIAVLDRTKEPGAQGEPLYMDVVTSLADAGRTDIKVIGGRYGLGSARTRLPPACSPSTRSWPRPTRSASFTVGIVDDVTKLSLRETSAPDTAPEGHRLLHVLGPRRRRHRRREQELHQDHRRPHRQVCPGLLPVRLQEDRRRHHQPPALRRQAHQEPVLHQQGRLRGLPQPELHHQGLQDGPEAQGRRRVPGQQPVELRGAGAPPRRRRQALHREEQDQARHDQRHRPRPADRHGQADQHHPPERLLLPGQGHPRGPGHQVHEGRRRRTPT